MKTIQKTNSNGTHSIPVRSYNPWSRLFRSDLLDFWDGDPTAETIPSINIAEEKDKYRVEMAAPGLKKEDFKINLEKNVLSVSAEKKAENVEEGKKYSKREYSFNSFVRSFTLPESADYAKITAEYIDGVLKLAVAKKEEAKIQSREIAVK